MMLRRWVTAGVATMVTLALTTIAAPSSPAATPRQVYVAMGDSYSAGPLIPPQTDPITCVRSGNDYPGLVSRQLGVAVFRDVTCSSASTVDFSHPQPANIPGGPPAPPQYQSLSSDTTLVTVGIGGNDIGLVGLALSCLNFAPPPIGHSCQAANGTTYQHRIDAFAATYGQVVDTIRAKAPDAKILLVGYPTTIKDGGCFPYQPILGNDATYLQGLIDRLNQQMSAQAAAHGATYVNIRTSSISHDSCQLPGTRWVEGFVPTSPAFPLHPNALGMQNAATRVLATLQG